jgi:arylsulfatase A
MPYLFRSTCMLAFWLFVSVGVLPGAIEARDAIAKPNIVFIMADDMGYGDVGCYNPESKIPTPHMDRLAREGIRYTDAHTSFAVCTPTRYGVLTGRYCWRTRMRHGVCSGYNGPLIEKDRLTVAGVLQRNGYATAAIGKWHLGMGFRLKDDDTLELPILLGASGIKGRDLDERIAFAKPIRNGPTAIGFDYFFGTAGCSTANPPYAFIENDRVVGQPVYRDGLGMAVPEWEHKNVDPTFAAKAVAYIEKQANSEKPLFMYICPSAPHEPCRRDVVPEFARDKSQAGARGDLVWLADWMVGEIVAALKRTGRYQDTLLIVTSDNGGLPGDLVVDAAGKTSSDALGPVYETFGHRASGKLRGFKAHNWEGGHRVPYIVTWPRRLKGGQVRDTFFSLQDLLPTCAELVGDELKEGEAEDAVSMLPLILDKDAKSRREFLITQSSYATYAIRKGKWKLIRGTKSSGGWARPRGKRAVQGEPGQLYDMEVDRYEINDLYEKMPDVVKELEALLAGQVGREEVPKKWDKFTGKVGP